MPLPGAAPRAHETRIGRTRPTDSPTSRRGCCGRSVRRSRRFDEDSLRLIRAARLSGQLDFSIEAQTLAAMRRTAPLVQYVSRERLGERAAQDVEGDQPSAGLRVLADTGLLGYAFPLLEAQRGVPQDKRAGDDLWAHSLASLDAAARSPETSDRLRLAALLHDVGKPSTFADGHFVGHDIEGAKLADELLASLAFGRRDIEPVTRLIGQHMFQYLPNWSDAAVRRFIRRVGRGSGARPAAPAPGRQRRQRPAGGRRPAARVARSGNGRAGPARAIGCA